MGASIESTESKGQGILAGLDRIDGNSIDQRARTRSATPPNRDERSVAAGDTAGNGVPAVRVPARDRAGDAIPVSGTRA